MFLKAVIKGIAVCSIVSMVFLGAANAGDKKAKVSPENAALALEHQTNGNKYDDAGRLKEAIDEYNKSLEYDAENPDTLYNLALVYLKANKSESAVEALEKLVKISRQDIEGYNLLGLAYRGCGREEDALKAWKKSLAIDPEQPNVKKMMNDKVDSQTLLKQ